MKKHKCLIVATLISVAGITPVVQAQGIPLTLGLQKDTPGDSQNVHEFAVRIADQLYPDLLRQHSGQTVQDILQSKPEYSRFLALVTRANLTAVLNGTTVDTSFSLVTFGKLTEGPSFPKNMVNVDTTSEKAGLDPTQIKNQIADEYYRAYIEAQKIAFAQEEKVTVFALTNTAFAKIPAATLAKIERDSASAAQFICGYIVNRGVYTQAIPHIITMHTLNGRVLSFGESKTKQPTINGVPVVGSELVGVNGVIHTLDAPFSSSSSKI